MSFHPLFFVHDEFTLGPTPGMRFHVLNQDIGPGKFGWRRGDIFNVTEIDAPLGNGSETDEEYLARKPWLSLVYVYGMQKGRAERALEKWYRAPKAGDKEFDDNEKFDDNDRHIYLNKKRWRFILDNEEDDEPLNAKRMAQRVELENTRRLVLFQPGVTQGPRRDNVDPWFYDKNRFDPDTQPDIDTFDRRPDLHKTPLKRFLRSRGRG